MASHDSIPAIPRHRHGIWNLRPRLNFQGDHHVKLLRGGDALFTAMGVAISQAHETVWLATYLFYHDEVAHSLALVLVEAARRGVKVKVVVDGFGSKSSLASLRAWLNHPGIELVVFRPIDRWWRWFSPSQLRRMHYKLCVVDGQAAFVGGINLIADRNELQHGWSDAPRLDFAVELRGPSVSQIEQTAQAIWTRASLGRNWREEVLNIVKSSSPLAIARQMAKRLRQSPPLRQPRPPLASLLPVRLAFVVRDNLRQRRAIERAYIDAIDGASIRIDLVTPYFYPGWKFRRALSQAAERGVHIRLLMQGKVDYRLAGLAAQVLYDNLLAKGLQIFEYTPAFLHAKMAVIDEAWTTLGSSNIDPFSLLLNLEANIVIQDKPFSAEVGHELDLAIAASRSVTASPNPTGTLAVLRRGFVAWLAYGFLRLAGLNARY
jgi:cardiolipin synthase